MREALGVKRSLAPGFLVAAPIIRDEPFERSLVLLAHHDPQGALGVIINRTLPARLDEVLSGLEGKPPDQPVLQGGPVAPNVAWLLHEGNGGEVSEGVFGVGRDLVLTVRRDHLEDLVRHPDNRRMHLFLGHSGWGPGQLDREMAAGVWIPAELDRALIFDVPYDDRWKAALKHLGIDPALLGTGGFLA